MRRHLLLSSAIAAALALPAGVFAQSQAPASSSPPPAKAMQEIKLTHVSLTDAIDYLRDASGANIEVDWKALETVGVTKDTPISLRLRNVPLRVALRKTLDSASPGVLDFVVDGNVITITSQEVADSKLVTRIIAVDDLLVDIPDFNDAPKMDLSQVSNSQSTSRSGKNLGSGSSSSSSGSSGGIFSGSSTGTDTQKNVSRDEKAQQLIDLIQTSIRPAVWDVNGGKAHIKYFNGSLIITAPNSVQQQIAG